MKRYLSITWRRERVSSVLPQTTLHQRWILRFCRDKGEDQVIYCCPSFLSFWINFLILHWFPIKPHGDITLLWRNYDPFFKCLIGNIHVSVKTIQEDHSDELNISASVVVDKAYMLLSLILCLIDTDFGGIMDYRLLLIPKV